MDEYKLKLARRVTKRLQGHRFDAIVLEVSKMETQIRACLDKKIAFDGKYLSLYMALNAFFVKDILMLENQSDEEEENATEVGTLNQLRRGTADLSDSSRGQEEEELLKKIRSETLLQANQRVREMLQNACAHLCPFHDEHNLEKSRHILEYLLCYTANYSQSGRSASEGADQTEDDPVLDHRESEDDALVDIPVPTTPPPHPHQSRLRPEMKMFRRGPVPPQTRPTGDIPHSVIYPLLHDKVPSSKIEIITLPSASQLDEAGIKFAPVNSGYLEHIQFLIKKASALLLPKVLLDDSTETI
eukprot:Gb_07693 [translate_table: standard]